MRHDIFRAFVLPVALIAAMSIILLPSLFLGRTDVAIRSEADAIDAKEPIDRLADLALFRIGYYRIYRYSSDDGTSEQILEPISDNELSKCAPHPVAAGLVAAESYARPAWRRNLEIALAYSWQALTGWLPDWSYGPAQIRLSTARAAFGQALAAIEPIAGPQPVPTEEQTFSSLQDLCSALAAAALVADPTLRFDTPVRDIAQAYRGGPSDPDLPGRVSYEMLAEKVTGRLSAEAYSSADITFRARPVLPPMQEPRFSGTDQPPAAEDASSDQSTAPAPQAKSSSSKILCLENKWSRRGFETRSVYLDEERLPDPADEGINLRQLRQSLAGIDPARTVLDIAVLVRDGQDEEPGMQTTHLPPWQSGQSFDVQSLSDFVGIANALEDAGLALNAGWRKITLTRNFSDPDLSVYPCPVEIGLTPLPDTMFSEFAAPVD